MPLTIPNSLADGDVISATEQNANFSACADALGNIVNSDISSDAGITSDRMSDKFGPTWIPLVLIPPAIAAGTIAPATEQIVPAATSAALGASSGTRLARFYPRIKAGRRVELVSITLHANGVTIGGADYPKVWVYHNATLLSGDGATVNADNTPFYLENSSPHTAPLAVLQNGDYLDFHIGSSGAGAPTIGVLTASICIKGELES